MNQPPETLVLHIMILVQRVSALSWMPCIAFLLTSTARFTQLEYQFTIFKPRVLPKSVT